MSIMAIDYGEAHTGIAISDPTNLLTGYSTTINSRKAEVVRGEIVALIASHKVDVLVLGFPKNMDGTDGKRAPLYRELAQKLEEETAITPVMWDERRTTVEAHNILASSGKNAKKRKKTVDAVAASLILQGYLDRLRHQASLKE